MTQRTANPCTPVRFRARPPVHRRHRHNPGTTSNPDPADEGSRGAEAPAIVRDDAGSRESGILKDSDKQFFKPLWRRVAVTGVCAIWSAIELANGNTLWGGLAGAAAAYAAWNFFVVWEADKTG